MVLTLIAIYPVHESINLHSWNGLQV